MFRIRSDNMFALPLYVVRTNNWKEKKKQINNIIDYKKIEKKGLHTFGTDRQNDGKSYIKDFVRIFKEEIDDWLDEINQEECLITDIWTVRYKKENFSQFIIMEHLDILALCILIMFQDCMKQPISCPH